MHTLFDDRDKFRINLSLFIPGLTYITSLAGQQKALEHPESPKILELKILDGISAVSLPSPHSQWHLLHVDDSAEMPSNHAGSEAISLKIASLPRERRDDPIHEMDNFMSSFKEKVDLVLSHTANIHISAHIILYVLCYMDVM